MAHPNRPNRGVTLVKLLGVLVVTGVLAAGVFVPVLGGIGLAGKSEADRFLNTTCTLQETTPTTKTTIYASDNKTVIAQFFAQNRTPVTLAQINKLTQLALIDTEDRRFYDHHGVDARGLLRAAVSNSESSGDTQGGSTLTMQYVKQLRLYNANSDAERAAAVVQNVDRKLQDAKCALDLEQRETAQLGSETAAKNKILESYFNIAFFGQNSYGIEAAAKTYFNTTALKLAPQQAALIVGLVQAPSQYDPYTNPQDALGRRNQVLDNLVTAGHMSAADATKYKALPLGLTAKTPPPVQMGCSYATAIPNAGFFCDYATDWLAAHNYSSDALLRDGLKIRTTLDAGLQAQGQNAVWSGEPGTQGGPFAADSPSSLVMPSIDPRNGYVTTMITSKHYVDPNNPDPNQTSVRLFTTAAAGAGSTYKYFTTLVALAAGVPIDFTLNAGAPYTAKHCPLDTDPNTGQESPYVARNAGSYSAVLPLNKALYESSNTYFVGLEDMLFMCNTAPLAQQAINLGMKALTVQGNTVGGQEATFTLGQKSTSPLELANAYATVANDGKYCPATPVISVTDQNGKPLPLKQSPCTQQVAPQIAREVVDTLVDDTQLSGGTATSRFGSWYANGGSPVASKTGTNNATSNNVDNNTNSAIWFVGLTPTLVSSAAVFNFQSPTSTISGLPGFDDNYAAGDAFGAAAGAYWLKAYGPTLAANPWSWPSPDDVSGVDVPDVTGQTPGDATATLTAAGFKVSIFDFPCGSSKPSGTLIGYAPHKAVPGSTITACVSNGVAPSTGYSYTYNGNGNGNGNGTVSPAPRNNGGGGNGNGGNGNGGGGGNGAVATDGNRPGNGGTPRR